MKSSEYQHMVDLCMDVLGSRRDSEIFLNAIKNPPEPNDELKRAVDEYHMLNDELIKREAIVRMVYEYPNDADLGAEMRKIFTKQ